MSRIENLFNLDQEISRRKLGKNILAVLGIASFASSCASPAKPEIATPVIKVAAATEAPKTPTTVPATATATATATVSPTNTPEATKTPEPTKTPETQRGPLPDWSVFAGEIKSPDMKTTLASLSIIQIPNPDTIVYYSVVKSDIREQRVENGGSVRPKYTGAGNDFKVGGIIIHYDQIKKEITGSATLFLKPEVYLNGKFELPLAGYGPDTFFEKLSEIAREYLPDSPYSATYPQQLIKTWAKPEQWPPYTPAK